MKSVYLAVLLTLISLFPVTAEDVVRPPSNDLNGLCRNIDNNSGCAKKIEKLQLKKYPNLVQRKGHRLTVQLANGKNKVYRTAKGDSYETSIAYFFRDYLPELGYILMEKMYYEGDAALLVNAATGKEYSFENLPVFSPNSQHFAVADIGGYSTDTVEIWRAEKDRLIREAAFSWQDESDSKWLDNERFQVYNISTNQNNQPTCTGALISRPNGRWQMRRFDYRGSCPK